jgi:hypothetical protein
VLATLLRGPYRQARVHLTGTPYRKSTSPGPTSDFPHPAPLLVSVRQITHGLLRGCRGAATGKLWGGGGEGHWRRASALATQLEGWHAQRPCRAQQPLHICNETNNYVSFLAKL